MKPERDSATRTWKVTGDTGIILVLLPGGWFNMGSQNQDPNGPNYDPASKDDEIPVSRVRLAPFLVSKYEMTQGQWKMLTGETPSTYGPGKKLAKETSLAHPVESITWDDAVRTLARLNLSLPTEAQWEFAARGGTTTPWFTGNLKESLRSAANVADQDYHAGSLPDAEYEKWSDGHGVHAPVGSYSPNQFGLYDVHGNVFEWCLDGWDVYSKHPPEPDTGLRKVPNDMFHIYRGGAWALPAWASRSAYRPYGNRNEGSPITGVRPVKQLSE